MKFLMIFNNLPFAVKMSLLGLLTVVMVLVPTVPLTKQLSANVDFNAQELSGIAPSKYAGDLLAALQQHRGLASFTLNGSNQSQRSIVAKDTDGLFAKLSESVQSGLQQPAITKQIQQLNQDWQKLESQVAAGGITSAESFARHNEIINVLVQDVQNQILDSSGLSYDPVAESYHLIIGALQNTPRLTEAVAQVRGTGAALLASGVQDPAQQLLIVRHLAEAQQPYIDLLRNIKVAAGLSEKANVKQLLTETQKIELGMQQLQKSVEEHILRPQSLTYSSDLYFNDASQVIDHIYQVSQKISGVLEQVLVERDQAYRADRTRLMTIVVGCALAFFSLAIYLVVSFSRGLNANVVTARAIMAKDFSKAKESARKDEIGALQRAMFEMNKGLEIAEQQARELADRAAADAEKAAKDAVVARENQRIRQALDETSTNALIVDADRKVIYANKSMMSMLRRAQSTLQQELPYFDTEKLVGGLVDVFEKQTGQATSFLSRLEQARTTDLLIAGIHLRVTATTIFRDHGERLGTVLEWLDRSQEVHAELEVEAVVQAAVRGDFHLRVEQQNKHGFMLKIAEGLNALTDTCERSLSDINRVLQAIADGDLTQRVSATYQGTFEALKAGCNQTANNLSEMLIEIRDASATINTAADEISRGNTDLSSRTEEQASSLEETASSMEELTGTVRQNADNAQQANRLAAQASEVAVTGGDLIRQVVDTMAAINDSARQISDIIGVIDGIAFQTNILALNAAVEAARAGEQGRGFAVVASEVRSLAQRSANAAKDIKGLISDSVTKIGNGNHLVGRSGQTMQDIVVAIKRVNDLMSDIAAASVEQATGLDEVGKSVSQMDNMTQQNAALVEEAAASAESLLSQANQLSVQVAKFKLDNEPRQVKAMAPRVPQATGRNAGMLKSNVAVLKAKTGSKQLARQQTAVDDEWEAF
jgi:methyl-accepting chemotaxis protein